MYENFYPYIYYKIIILQYNINKLLIKKIVIINKYIYIYNIIFCTSSCADLTYNTRVVSRLRLKSFL